MAIDNNYQAENTMDTRMIAMGRRPLMEGFSLLGFEVHHDASIDDVEKTLSELIQTEQKALLLLETYLAHAELACLSDVRKHGGKIIVTEVPAINACDDYHPYIEDLLSQVLGHHAVVDETHE